MKMHAICRTCLMHVVDSASISNPIHQLMLCLPEINVRTALADPRICSDCQMSLDIMYNFKIQCREIEEKIIGYMKHHGTIDLHNLIINDYWMNNSKRLRDSNKICRTCLQLIIDSSSIISLKEKFNYKHKLITCVPELNLRTIPDPKLCKDCCRVLDLVHKFKIQCREVEEKIGNYLRLNGVVGMDIELPNIIVKNEMEDYVFIKTEQMVAIKSDIEDYKQKDMTIKQEKFDSCIANGEATDDNKLIVKKLHECSICCYKTEHKYRLNRHVLIHSVEKRFTCSACNYQTNERSIFKKHIALHAGENVFTCTQCQFKTIKKSNLTRHVRLHTGEKPFECTQCQFKTHDATILKLHNLKHAGAKHFNCAKCEFDIQYRSGVHSSRLKHTCKRQYQCFNCNYKTNDRSTFIHHIYKHTGEKPFECIHCNYRTSIKSHLNRHVLNHTGEKRFACSVCDYKTNYKWTLKSHALSHSNNSKLLECPQCDYKTISRKYFKKHALVHKKGVASKS